MKFEARWFRDTEGNYLSLNNSDRSVIKFEAIDKEAAVQYCIEKENKDSEISFEERVLVREIN